MRALSRLISTAWVFLAVWPTHTHGRHVLLDKVLSDNPPPGQSDASCAHLVRAGLEEGVDAKGRPLVEPEVHHMIDAMRKSWWQCASAVANALAKYGSEVEDAFQMEQRSITKNLNEIRSALEKGKPVQSISPAFEWAQSGDWIYINAKMSHKLDAPATLNVVSEGVRIAERSLNFAASKDQKRFALDLALYSDIDPEPSSISWGSVGRVTFTLKKAEGGVVWPALLAEGQKKPVNMHVWWTKQEEYADEIDAIEDAASEAEAKAAKSSVKDAVDKAEDDEAGVAAAAEKKPLTPEARLQKAKKEATMALNKERKERFEELEKEKRAATKAIDAEAASKKKEAEEALQEKKLAVHDEIDDLVKKKHAEIEASWRTEL